MSQQREKFYITTPIYYVNARPHIGHTYTTVVCDAIARRQRMMGRDTYFLTGTDEHGQKIERSAAAAGKSPQEFADEVSTQFRALWDRMGISYDQFIRTTSAEHMRGVQAMFRLLKERVYIYKGSYTGQYCVRDELYVEDNSPGAPCPLCGRVTETVQEENYFFKLSEMAGPLLRLYEEQPELIYPEARRYEHYWPADVHMIGKEIVRFHCVYWPAFLIAAGMPLPRRIVAHGWLLFEESKISKSRGNVVRSETILEVLGPDALRYFLFREVAFGQVGSFSFDALVQRFNSDLANGLGNLASRVLSMVQRYFDGEIPQPGGDDERTPAETAIASLAGETVAEYHRLFEAFQFSRALETLWSLLSAVDKYIVETQPWTLAGKDEASRLRLGAILYTTAEALRIICALVHPIIPDSTAKVFTQLGVGNVAETDLSSLRWGQLKPGTRLGKIEAVFPRADKSAIERMQQMEEERKTEAAPAAETGPAGAETTTAASAAALSAQSAAAVVSASSAPAPAPLAPEISIDDFVKVDLRVGTVVTAEKVEKADKLLRLTVDIGSEVRQIVAGIAKAYAPEKLVGRTVVIVANLAPRKLRGIESRGMIVAASLGEDDQPALAGFLEEVPN